MCRDSEDLLRFLVRHTLSSATFGVSVAVNLVVSILLVFLSVVIDVTCGATLVVVVVRGVVTLTELCFPVLGFRVFVCLLTRFVSLIVCG